MPGRKIPLVNGQVYHVFNRGINRQQTFTTKLDFQRAIKTINFYKASNCPIRLSKFLSLDGKRQNEILEVMEKSQKLVQIISFCLMPNHFHFLLRQEMDNGISKFLSNFQNSYTRYFNVKHKRDGSLFLDQFKAVIIETDEQLIHVSRYIHLNPYTGFVVKEISDLELYAWSSLPEYLNGNFTISDGGLVLGMFKNNTSYKNFVFDQAEYQRTIKQITHLVLE